MNTIFKQDQEVEDILFGKGTVCAVRENQPAYAIYVRFPNGKVRTYTRDGRENTEHQIATLFPFKTDVTVGQRFEPRKVTVDVYVDVYDRPDRSLCTFGNLRIGTDRDAMPRREDRLTHKACNGKLTFTVYE